VPGFDPFSQQRHQIFAAIDLNTTPQLEINACAAPVEGRNAVRRSVLAPLFLQSSGAFGMVTNP
jgi:hypothetical protein